MDSPGPTHPRPLLPRSPRAFACESITMSLFLFGLYLVLAPGLTAHVTDECDWTDSGVAWVAPESEAGVRPVYLRCAEGAVEWRYPRDALRLVLSLGSSSATDFRGCVRVSERSGARISSQEAASLRVLYTPDDGRHPRTPRCFSSSGGQAVLYVEPLADLYRHVPSALHFRYHLLPRRHAHPECGPCSAEHLLRLFCSCAFAARGRVLRVIPDVNLERTEVRVLASRVYRQNALIFAPHRRPHRKRKKKVTGSVYFPRRCAVDSARGEDFLFLGHFLLDTPTVECAPRWQQWALVAANGSGRQCNIPSH